jgi:putative hemolysin
MTLLLIDFLRCSYRVRAIRPTLSTLHYIASLALASSKISPNPILYTFETCFFEKNEELSTVTRNRVYWLSLSIFLSAPEMSFQLSQAYQYQYCQNRGYNRQRIQSRPAGHPYVCHQPYRRRRRIDLLRQIQRSQVTTRADKPPANWDI